MKEVRSLPYEQTTIWLLTKHYAKRVPSISYSFGLYVNKELVGVVSYGIPASPALMKGLCGAEYKECVLELNRLVINDDAPKNSASFLVGRSLRMLPKPSIVVSYADTGQNHVGYVYQATNFIYTGITAKRTEWAVKGMEHLHSKRISSAGGGRTLQAMKEEHGDNFYYRERSQKHRYVFFVGCPKEIKNSLKYPILPYPKGKSERYDASADIPTQGVLF